MKLNEEYLPEEYIKEELIEIFAKFLELCRYINKIALKLDESPMFICCNTVVFFLSCENSLEKDSI